MFYDGINILLKIEDFQAELINMPFLSPSLIPLLQYFIPVIEIILGLFLIYPRTRITGNYAVYFFMLCITLYGISTLTVFKYYVYFCVPEGCTLQYSYYAKYLPVYATCFILTLFNVFVIKKPISLIVNKD